MSAGGGGPSKPGISQWHLEGLRQQPLPPETPAGTWAEAQRITLPGPFFQPRWFPGEDASCSGGGAWTEWGTRIWVQTRSGG